MSHFGGYPQPKLSSEWLHHQSSLQRLQLHIGVQEEDFLVWRVLDKQGVRSFTKLYSGVDIKKLTEAFNAALDQAFEEGFVTSAQASDQRRRPAQVEALLNSTSQPAQSSSRPASRSSLLYGSSDRKRRPRKP